MWYLFCLFSWFMILMPSWSRMRIIWVFCNQHLLSWFMFMIFMIYFLDGIIILKILLSIIQLHLRENLYYPLSWFMFYLVSWSCQCPSLYYTTLFAWKLYTSSTFSNFIGYYHICAIFNVLLYTSWLYHDPYNVLLSLIYCNYLDLLNYLDLSHSSLFCFRHCNSRSH